MCIFILKNLYCNKMSHIFALLLTKILNIDMPANNHFRVFRDFRSIINKNISCDDKESLKSDLSKALGKTPGTVNNKLSGRNGITKTEMPLFRKIFRKYGIEIQ